MLFLDELDVFEIRREHRPSFDIEYLDSKILSGGYLDVKRNLMNTFPHA
jgi:hypothetical protein